ncbi:Glycerol kinase [Aduncisulcus paluster]|uniref:glycerol kinase n=1 Tax=Aduncisulcus paluster TaxID=2918883 RepID=A0ABQ5JSI3_9EUKA|nr:Glycerol kinase [Aduncisulcus paluster]
METDKTKRTLIASIDQGTTSSRCIIFNKIGEIITCSQLEHKQLTPRPGYTEHDGREIMGAVLNCINRACEQLKDLGYDSSQVKTVGVTNQRETIVFWDSVSGHPLCNAIVWHDTRTQSMIDKISKDEKIVSMIKDKTGLKVSAYFSASKIKWTLENNEQVKKAYDRKTLRMGTIDSWIIFNLTNGKVHATDVSNASRTSLFNIHSLEWDEELCHLFGLTNGPFPYLPKVMPSASNFGMIDDPTCYLSGVNICSCIGDQQSALFGHLCFNPTDTKVTLGTGCFMLVNTGHMAVSSASGVLTTIGWQIDYYNPCTSESEESTTSVSKPQPVVYALEGSVAIGGAAVNWLRDKLRIITNPDETESIARAVTDCGGVVFVPAFTGLFTPHWDSTARGVIVGLTSYTSRDHIVRATLEGVCHCVRDVYTAVKADVLTERESMGGAVKEEDMFQFMSVDGGMTRNGFVCETLASFSDSRVARPKMVECTALGAALLAGIAAGIYKDESDVKDWLYSKGVCGERAVFDPIMTDEERKVEEERWIDALERSKGLAGK